jgi:ABC-2 type transport system permease protein
MTSLVWRSFLAVAHKEIIHARRDKFALRQLVVLQTLQLLMLGFIDTTVRDLPTVIVDQDQSTESRELVGKIKATGTFDVKYVTNSSGQARGLIREGRASVAVIVPPEYHRDRSRGERASTLVLVDGSDPVASNQALASINGLAAAMNFEASTNVQTATTLIPHTIILYNPDGRTTNYMLPSLLAVMIGTAFLYLSANALVRERDRGNLERLLMTPLNLTGLMLGKLAPYFVIGLIDVIIFILIMRWVFSVPIHGNVGLLVFAEALYLLTVLSLGTFFAAAARNAGEVGGRTALLQLPNLFLSGYIFPLTSLPKFLLPISYILPATHMIQVMRGIVLRGASFTDLLPEFIYLMVAPAVLTVLSVRRFAASVQQG